MGLFRYAVLLLVAFGGLVPSVTQAQTGSQQCGVSEAVPSGCRQFQAQGTTPAGSPILFQFSSAVLPSALHAGEYMTGAVEGMQESMDMGEAQISQNFGQEQVAMQGTFFSGSKTFDIGAVAFQVEDQVGMWAVAGQGIDAFSVLEEVLLRVQAREPSNDDDYSRVLAILPTVEDLPPGFNLSFEEFSSDLAISATEAAQKGEPTQSELKATIAALEKQLEESKSRPYPPEDHLVASH